jgi:hypothetical protein
VNGLGSKDVNYEYDLDGKRTRVSVSPPPNWTYDYTYSYDAQGRFEKIFSTGLANPYWQYSYDAASNETQRYNWYSQVAQTYPRDALNRMTRRDLKDGAITLSSEGYGYDKMNRLQTVTRTEDGNKTDQFDYYLDGELKSAQYQLAAATPTPTPTPTPPVGVATPTFSTSGGAPASKYLSMYCQTAQATIFYTVSKTGYVTPTHSGGSPTGSTLIYTGPVLVMVNEEKYFSALGYKSGMSDSAVAKIFVTNPSNQSPSLDTPATTPHSVT